MAGGEGEWGEWGGGGGGTGREGGGANLPQQFSVHVTRFHDTTPSPAAPPTFLFSSLLVLYPPTASNPPPHTHTHTHTLLHPSTLPSLWLRRYPVFRPRSEPLSGRCSSKSKITTRIEHRSSPQCDAVTARALPAASRANQPQQVNRYTGSNRMEVGGWGGGWGHSVGGGGGEVGGGGWGCTVDLHPTHPQHTDERKLQGEVKRKETRWSVTAERLDKNLVFIISLSPLETNRGLPCRAIDPSVERWRGGGGSEGRLYAPFDEAITRIKHR